MYCLSSSVEYVLLSWGGEQSRSSKLVERNRSSSNDVALTVLGCSTSGGDLGLLQELIRPRASEDPLFLPDLLTRPPIFSQPTRPFEIKNDPIGPGTRAGNHGQNFSREASPPCYSRVIWLTSISPNDSTIQASSKLCKWPAYSLPLEVITAYPGTLGFDDIFRSVGTAWWWHCL